jgi:uncharacterized protein YjbI with pentapeptide repeats
MSIHTFSNAMLREMQDELKNHRLHGVRADHENTTYLELIQEDLDKALPLWEEIKAAYAQANGAVPDKTAMEANTVSVEPPTPQAETESLSPLIQVQLDEILAQHAMWLNDWRLGKRANLTRANLTRANLTRANLTDADLTHADLTHADLTGANLTDADLTHADLTGANLTDADLTHADLTHADLTGANLTGANLTRANLTRANLTKIKKDVWAVLAENPHEAAGVLTALQEGRVNGSTYSGTCACLVGTIANIKDVDYRSLHTDATRAAERWFMGIKEGDTPANNPVAAISAEWVKEFIATLPAAPEV